jgi:hypothetical protein
MVRSVIGATDGSAGQAYGCRVMVLQIVVTPDCFGCDEASRLATLMRREFPALEVELHILTGAEPVPPGVVATPTYLLDGQPIFLGNPRPAALVAEVASHVRTATGATARTTVRRRVYR